jgi:hypothetical protein
VTTRIITVIGHSRLPLGPPEILEPTVKRDATTVLSHSKFGRYFRPQPLERVVDPLRCVNLGSDTSPYYHGYGWLPCFLDRNTQVLTPVLNSATHDGQWGLRPISGEELLLCNDIGALQVNLLVDECLGNTFYSLVLPGKCLVAGFRALFHEGGGMEIGKKDASVDGMEIGKKDASVDGMDDGLDGRTEDASTSFDPRVSSTRMASVDEMDGKFEGGGMEIDKKDASGDGMDDGMDGRTEDASTSFDPRV